MKLQGLSGKIKFTGAFSRTNSEKVIKLDTADGRVIFASLQAHFNGDEALFADDNGELKAGWRTYQNQHGQTWLTDKPQTMIQ